MDLVTVFLAGGGCYNPRKQIAIRTEIYAMSQLQVLQLLESADSEGDHTPERDAALKLVRDGHAKLVATHSVLTTAGQRTKLDDTVQIEFDQPAAPVATDDKAASAIEPNTRAYGTILEVEPNIDADGFTVNLNLALEHHTAEPEFIGHRPLRYHAKAIQTNCVLIDGIYLVLGTWKPTGRPEYEETGVRHLVFVTANLQTP
ncbi:MAG: hypothetical protein ACI9UA_000273 [Pseudoalteromonas tetraodonis]|jgi:hypothetical protein